MTRDRTALGPSRAGPAPSIGKPAIGRRVPGPIVLLGGLLGGMAWGVMARVWMRFISTDPEFTWSGTLFIVIGFGIVGLAQAGAYLGRRRRLSRPRMTFLRVVSFVGLLPLGMAAGAIAFPTVVLAPLALAHVDWPRWTRSLLGALALAPPVAVAGLLMDELSTPRALVGWLWFLVIYAGLVWAARFTLAPQLDGWRAPRAVRIIGVAALVLGILGAMALAVGLAR